MVKFSIYLNRRVFVMRNMRSDIYAIAETTTHYKNMGFILSHIVNKVKLLEDPGSCSRYPVPHAP